MGLLDCLAIVIFLEARGEPLQGQIAVGQVVMNRVSSEKYPDSICAVVEQPDQFAFNLSKTPSTAAYFVALSLPHHKDLVGG
ncbi:MAG: cell wall hydrolase, partial [Phycisphaerae bacterium]|nr:cell wall hydrolase [Phycisphaerae bacterium]